MTATSKHPIVLTTVGSFHRQIVERLKELGATVVIADSARSAASLYRHATHVLLPGGNDVHPSNYNQIRKFAGASDMRRDAIEIMIADLALIDRKPLFGICRGHQVITIAAGGTLYQDIFNQTGIAHGYMSHGILIERGTLLHEVMGGRVAAIVNSYHHQATCKVPRGWIVAARSIDGVIEAISHPSLPVVSVQWHPEVLVGAASTLLFKKWLALDGTNGKSK